MNAADAAALIRSNLARGAEPLAGLPNAPATLAAALAGVAGLQPLSALQVEILNPTRLRLGLQASRPWSIPGLFPGTLAEAELAAELEVGEGPPSTMSLRGAATVPGLLERAAVSGSLACGPIWLLPLTARVGGVTLATVTAALPITWVAAAIEGLGIVAPAIDMLMLGLHLTRFEWRVLGFEGGVELAGIPLRIGAEFSPGPTIYGRLAEGRSLGVRDLAGRLGLPASLLPDVLVDELGLAADPGAGNIELDARIALPWSLRFADRTIALTDVSLHLARAGTWQLAIEAGWSLGGVPLRAEARVLPGATGLELWLGSLPDTSVRASTLLAALLPVGLPGELPDFELRDLYVGLDTGAGTFRLGAASPTVWTLPLGGLSLRDVELELARAPAGGLSGAVAGTIDLGGTSLRVGYRFPGDLVLAGEVESFPLSPLMQALCGAAALVGLPMPAGVLALELREVQLRVAVAARHFAIAGLIPGFGRAEVAAIGSQLTLGVALDPAWRPSQLHAALAPLDALRLSNTRLVLATDPGAPPPTTITVPGGTLARGLTLYTTLDLGGLGLDEILARTTLELRAAIASDPSQAALEAALAGRIALGEGVAMTGSVVRLRLDGPSLAIVGTAEILLSGTTLQFEGALAVAPRSATLSATLRGTWRDPFGLQSIELTDVALKLGVSYPPLAPVVAIAARLKVGAVTGAVAVQLDTSQPTHCMLAVRFDRLAMLDMLESFGGSQLTGLLPAPLRDLLGSLSWSAVDVYIVPQGTWIGTTFFPPGFRLQGRLSVLGASAFARVEIQRGALLSAAGEVDPIAIPGLFQLVGASGAGKAALLLELALGRPPRFELDGAVELLGMRASARILLSSGGFSFEAQGQLFGAFSATVRAAGASLGNAAGFSLAVTMHADLLGYLAQQAIALIQNIAGSAIQQLTAARTSVSNARTELARLDAEISAARARVRAARDKLAADLASLRSQVSAAQANVNKIQADINLKRQRIATLQAEIAAKNAWLASRPWWEIPWATVVTSAYVAPRLAEISILYGQIAALEATRIAAIAVLEALKLSLAVIEYTISHLVPIDLDPAVAPLIALRVTAAAVLDAALAALGLLEVSIGAVASVGTQVIALGAGALVVRSASFSASLAAASGGSVTMRLDLTFLGQARTIDLAFSFHNPAASLQTLVQALLP
jgi:hypothetical protein